MKIHLNVWRQKNAQTNGKFETYDLDNISEDMSFLEMLDVLNEGLINDGKEPVVFDHDCREGICELAQWLLMASHMGHKSSPPLVSFT